MCRFSFVTQVKGTIQNVDVYSGSIFNDYGRKNKYEGWLWSDNWNIYIEKKTSKIVKIFTITNLFSLSSILIFNHSIRQEK